jgi:hypothetical protein
MDIIEKNIDRLTNLIEEITGINSVLYIELISVEIRENSLFKIAGKGYNIANYLEKVNEHLRDKKNSSLLLMKHESDDGFIFLQERKIRKSEPILHIEEKEPYSKEEKYRKTEELKGSQIEIQWERWIEMAQSSFPDMQHACFLHSELAIPFLQNTVKIISGIWVFLSEPVDDLQELEKTLKSGIYEYIIYTLLPDKIQQIERQDTFDSLAHSQKHYIHSIKSISKHLGGKEKQKLEYIYNSLNGFLAVSKSYRERTLENNREENISLSNVVRNMVELFENTILADIEILDLSLKGNDNRLDNLYNNNRNSTLFSGNFRVINLSKSKFLMYVPQMLIKEAIVNALENANSDNPKIAINFEETGLEIVLSISNNGLSSRQDIKEIIYPQNPFKLGCRLIIDLSKILGWKFDAVSNYKDQTTYYFTIMK